MGRAKEGRAMKKIYAKPTLVKEQKLASISAAASNVKVM